MILAGHQPNFLPWLGYFHKISKADVFVISNHVQYSPKTWTNRTQIRLNNSDTCFINVPVSANSTSIIKDVQIPNSTWIRKMMRTIEDNYKKAPCFNDVIPILEIISNQRYLLSDLNTELILYIVKRLELNTKIVIGADLHLEQGKSNHIVDACMKLSCSTYLAGMGNDYHDYELFSSKGITIQKTNFKHPVYIQGKHPFMAGLSVLDAIAHVGFENLPVLLHNDN